MYSFWLDMFSYIDLFFFLARAAALQSVAAWRSTGNDVVAPISAVIAKLSSSCQVQCQSTWTETSPIITVKPPTPLSYFKAELKGVKGKVGLLNKYNKTRCLVNR